MAWKNTRVVIMQFSFSNPNVIPSAIKRLDKETIEERVERKSHSTGIMVIEPTEKCCVEEFIDELEKIGFQLVDSFYKERMSPGKSNYHMIRFIFWRNDFAEPSEEFKKVFGVVRESLKTICQEALWRVRAFDNPFYKDGEEIKGQRAISINLEARNPLFLPDGSQVVAWEKDGAGRRIGTAPVPIQPAHKLVIIDGEIGLIPIS